MRILLDTHLALWLALWRDRLTAIELDLIGADTHLIAVSAVSIWELRLKWNSFHASGDRKGPASPDAVLRILDGYEVAIEPLTAAQAAAALHPPLDHKDPFDELLMVQAQELDMMLLTRDARLIGHPLALPSIA